MKRFIPALVLLLITSAALVRGVSQSRPAPEIVEISLEAKEGFERATFKSYGTVFKITLDEGGTATYYGKSNVKLIGNYQGTISDSEFKKLSQLLLARGLLELPENSLAPAEESEGNYFKPKTILTITFAGGKQKTVWRLTDLSPDERAKLPAAIFEIEKAIVDAGAGVKWREVE